MRTPYAVRLILRVILIPLAAGSCKNGPSSPPDDASGEAEIAIEPTSIVLPLFGAAIFRAVVTGLEDEAVIWSVEEGSTGGTIRGAGFYNAPGGGGTFHVRATSVEDPALFASAEVRVSLDWDCPDEPPEPPYALAWSRDMKSWRNQAYFYYQGPGELVWSQGALWVAHGHHLQHWSDGGDFLGWTGSARLDLTPEAGPDDSVDAGRGYHADYSEQLYPHSSHEDGGFDGAGGVARDESGRLYVGGNELQVLDALGGFTQRWSGIHAGIVALSPSGLLYLLGYGDSGGVDYGLYRFYANAQPVDALLVLDGEPVVQHVRFGSMGFDADGLCYLPFRHAERLVALLSTDLEYLGSTLRYGNDPCTSHAGPTAVDTEGNCFVADFTTFGLKKFDPSGFPLAAWTLDGVVPRGLCLDPEGNVYVSAERVSIGEDNVGVLLKFEPSAQ